MDPLFSETTTRLSFEGVSHVHSKKFSHTHELEEDVLKSQCLEKASQKPRQGSGSQKHGASKQDRQPYRDLDGLNYDTLPKTCDAPVGLKLLHPAGLRLWVVGLHFWGVWSAHFQVGPFVLQSEFDGHCQHPCGRCLFQSGRFAELRLDWGP